MANGSCNREDLLKLRRDMLSMIDAISGNSQSQCSHCGNCSFASWAIRHHAGHGFYVGPPAAVVLLSQGDVDRLRRICLHLCLRPLADIIALRRSGRERSGTDRGSRTSREARWEVRNLRSSVSLRKRVPASTIAMQPARSPISFGLLRSRTLFRRGFDQRLRFPARAVELQDLVKRR